MELYGIELAGLLFKDAFFGTGILSSLSALFRVTVVLFCVTALSVTRHQLR